LNDRLTQILDSQTNVKTLRYDGLKRKIWMNDPDSGISTNAYDDASNLTETTDAKNQRISYTYDGANRMLTEDYHDENSPGVLAITVRQISLITTTRRWDKSTRGTVHVLPLETPKECSPGLRIRPGRSTHSYDSRGVLSGL
jgi:YD repeat-containing protein